MVDILCGVLAGDPPGFRRTPGDVALHFLAYHVDAFCDPGEFTSHLVSFLSGLSDSPPAPGLDRVLYAGLAEHETERDRRANGIPYHPDVVDYFRATAIEHGVTAEL